jgi:hypothetical protein
MTTAAITRTFGYHIFDTLFSMDSKDRIHPQMVDDCATSADGLSQWSQLRNYLARNGISWSIARPLRMTTGKCWMGRRPFASEWVPRSQQQNSHSSCHAG